MDVAGAVITAVVGFGGVTLGSLLALRNERRSRSDALLVEALNDAVAAIAEVAGGVPGAVPRYASATSRIALHGPPEIVTALRRFQDDATTGTRDGRERLIATIQIARTQLRHGKVADDDIRVLLFGPDEI